MFNKQKLEGCFAWRNRDLTFSVGEADARERFLARLLPENFVADERLIGGCAWMEAQPHGIGVRAHGDGNGFNSTLSPHDDRSATRALETADDQVAFYLGCFNVRP